MVAQPYIMLDRILIGSQCGQKVHQTPFQQVAVQDHPHLQETLPQKITNTKRAGSGAGQRPCLVSRRPSIQHPAQEREREREGKEKGRGGEEERKGERGNGGRKRKGREEKRKEKTISFNNF
jgi:hypothetical protein